MTSHTYATLALQAGVNVKIVSARLGHANIALALNVFSHAIPEMDEEAVETFASFMGHTSTGGSELSWPASQEAYQRGSSEPSAIRGKEREHG